MNPWKRLAMAISAARSDNFGGKVLLSLEDAEALLALAPKNRAGDQQALMASDK